MHKSAYYAACAHNILYAVRHNTRVKKMYAMIKKL